MKSFAESDKTVIQGMMDIYLVVLKIYLLLDITFKIQEGKLSVTDKLLPEITSVFLESVEGETKVRGRPKYRTGGLWLVRCATDCATWPNINKRCIQHKEDKR